MIKQKYYGPDAGQEKTKQSKTEVIDKDDQLTVVDEEKKDALYSLPVDLEAKAQNCGNQVAVPNSIGMSPDSRYEVKEGYRISPNANNTMQSLSHLQHFEATVKNVWYKAPAYPVIKDPGH